MIPVKRKSLILVLLLGLGGTSFLAVSSFWKSFASSADPTTDSTTAFLSQAIIDLKKSCELPNNSPQSSEIVEPSNNQPTSATSANSIQPSPPSPASPQAVPSPSPQATTSETATNALPVSPCLNLSESIGLIQSVALAEPQPTEPLSLQKSFFSLFGWLKPSEAASNPQQPEELKVNIPPITDFPKINPQARLASVPILMYHDILPKKEVFFDVTPEELEAHFQKIKAAGLTPISPDALYAHLRTGVPLPNKPVLLSFDDGYGGHYQYVYPLLKKYNFPAVFSIYLNKVEGKTKRSSVTWAQLKEMAADPLVTIASHSIKHPRDLRPLTDDELNQEVIQSKVLLEKQLGIPIRYFTYPEGKYDARVKQWAIAAGYKMAFSMDDLNEGYAGQSPDLFSISRFGQSSIDKAIAKAWGGYPAPIAANQFNLTTSVQKQEFTINGTEIVLVSGGKPRTIHADSRYLVHEILKDTGAIAGVDGTFFSLKTLTSNVLIGPALSSNRGFIPGNNGENKKLAGRPLALISANNVRFIPFDPDKHNTLEGIQKESTDGNWISDAFVGGAWLVKDSKARTPESFNSLYGFDANRNRAFWGINQAGQPVVGVTRTLVDAVSLGQILEQLGFRDAIMVDSGASADVAFEGKSQVSYTPRPVPHAIGLFPKDYEEPAGPHFIKPSESK